MFGAIDIGTNSVRLLIGQREAGRVKPVCRQLSTTRLGQGLQKTGLLQEEAVRRTVQTLACYARILEEYGVKKYRAVATSAVRDAANRELLLKAAREQGLEVEIISGEEEAWLSYTGAVSVHRELKNPVVLDIGGGSTEMIFQLQGQIRSSSTDVGAVRCTEASWSEEDIRQALAEALTQLPPSPFSLVGVGGTITTLAAIDQELEPYDSQRVQGYVLTKKAVEAIEKRLSALSLEERRQVPGLQPERADIILAGIKILRVILDQLAVAELVVSESDILDGIILSLD